MKRYTFFIESIGYLEVFTTKVDDAFSQARLYRKGDEEIILVDIKEYKF